MPSRSKRKGQILLPSVNRCGSVMFRWWFYSSRGCPPQSLCSTSPRNASAVGGVCCRTLALHSSAVAGRHVFPRSATVVFYLESWYCACRFQMALCCVSDIAALAVQAPTEPFILFCGSNSLFISSVDLNELHSDPHLSSFQGHDSEFSSPFCCSFTWHKSPW